MKKLTTIILAIVLSLGVLAACVPDPPAGQTWRMQDDFSGTTVDTSRWYTAWLADGTTHGANGSENACWSSSNESVSDGYLHLKLTNTQCSTGTPWTGSGVTSKYATPAGQTTAHFEVIARFPVTGTNGYANWGAVWANGKDAGSCSDWPERGELDIAEGLGANSLKSTTHYAESCGGNSQIQHLTSSSNDGNFHDYAVDIRPGSKSCSSGWSPEDIVYSMDHNNVGTDTVCVKLTGFYFVLNNTCSDTYGGPCVDNSVVDIDFVGISTP
jgi:beta-glucanase (GH16 family)